MIAVNPYSRVNVDIPNISLAYAATALSAQVVDFNTSPRPMDVLLKQETDVLAISVRSLNVMEAERIGREYRKIHQGVRLVSIGSGIDIQCCYPYRRWEDHVGIDADFSDAYPFPEYELFDTFPLFLENWQRNRWRYAIMTSLGCPFPCMHCMCKNRRWRPRSAENAAEELQRARERWGIHSFLILDDCFNVNRGRVLRFCQLVKPLNLAWECANGLRADLFDEELAQRLAEAGCTQVSFGIESIDDQVLTNISKAETFHNIECAVKTATRYFKSVNGFFIIGLPGSSFISDRAGLEWSRSVGINAHFSYYVPQGLQLPNDEVFYGEGARPLSNAYSYEEQEQLFLETSGMRPAVPAGNQVQ
jgi:radical SAM superfamily enzyme YgiQ (UPF0313 family)